MRAFKGYHPAVNLIYFVAVITYAMIFMHPLCLAISLVCSLVCYIQCNGRRAVRFVLTGLLPITLITALLNPVFNHQGVTVLCYLPSGNPLTLEAIAYGIGAGVMLSAVMCWFGCFHAVMTSDKLIYLFSRLTPALSLVFSMALRLVPRFRFQLKKITHAQKGATMGVDNNSVIFRARAGLTSISAMVTQALEQSVDMADSMRGRGYGLPRRTAYALFSFDKRDLMVFCGILLCAGYVLAGSILGDVRFVYYPSMNGAGVSARSVSIYGVYALLCLIPVFIQLQEDYKWKAINAKV